MRNGYVTVYCPRHHRADSTGCVYEHILVAEQMLGRKLREKEVVHHIDKNRSNNSIENLMVFDTAADHTAFHKGSEVYKYNDVWKANRKDKTQTCKCCGLTYIPTNTTQQCCSQDCANRMRQKISNIHQLIVDLYAEDGNMSRVARKYNVTSNWIAKLLKQNNYPFHSADYKQN